MEQSTFKNILIVILLLLIHVACENMDFLNPVYDEDGSGHDQDVPEDWINISPPNYDGDVIAFSPMYKEDKTIFAGGWDFFYKSTDGGNSWNVIKWWEENTEFSIFSFGISPNYAEDSTIFLGTSQGLFYTVK